MTSKKDREIIGQDNIQSFFSVYYEMRRDKWPGRLKELAQSVIAYTVFDPEDAGPEVCSPVAEIYKIYHRMALAEGKKELAKDLKKDIDRWQKGATK